MSGGKENLFNLLRFYPLPFMPDVSRFVQLQNIREG